MATAKLTISVKRRLPDGSEVFIAPGIEVQCPEHELDPKQAEVTERIQSWMDSLISLYPDSDPIDGAEDEEDEDETEEDETEDEDEGDEDGGEEDDLTEDDIRKMKKADLVALAKDYEIKLESTKVPDMKEELIAELFEEGDEEDEDEDGDEDEDDEDEEGYTEAELKEMKLGELTDIAEEWELDVDVPKGAKMAAKKKLYIEAILEAQEEDEE